MVGIVILVATLAVFAGAGGWYLWALDRIKFPEGQKLSYAYRGYTVHTVVEPSCAVDVQTLVFMAKAGEKAVAATSDSWVSLSANHEYALDSTRATAEKEVLVWWVSAETMDGIRPNCASVQMLAPMYQGTSKVPMLVIRRSLDVEARVTGEPVIHEMLHALMSTVDYNHEALSVWAANQGKFKTGPTVQSASEDLYKKYAMEG